MISKRDRDIIASIPPKRHNNPLYREQLQAWYEYQKQRRAELEAEYERRKEKREKRKRGVDNQSES